MKPDTPSIRSAVRRARQRLIRGDVARGAGRLLTLLGLSLLLACVADNLIRLPAGLRLAVTGSLAGAAAALFGARVWDPIRRRRRHEAVAVELEKRFGVPHNTLINAWQFEGNGLQARERLFGEAVNAEAAVALDRIPPRALWDWERLKRELRLFAGCALLAAAYGAGAPRYAAAAIQRLLMPLADIPPAGRALLTVQPDRDIEIGEGESLSVLVTATDPDGKPLPEPPTLRRRDLAATIPTAPGEGDPPMLAVPGRPGGWSYGFTRVERSFAFRVFAADTYSRTVRVTVRPNPRLAASAFRVEPPAYTALPTETRPGPPAGVSALPGSRLVATVRVQPDSGALTWTDAGGEASLERAGTDFRHALVLTNAGPYAIACPRPGGGADWVIAEGRLALEEDRPPEVDFETPDRNRFVNPGGSVELPVKAEDDYGVSWIRVTARRFEDTDGATGLTVRTWRYMGPPGPRKPPAETLRLELDPAAFTPGAIWALEAEAGDFSPGERAGKSAPLLLRIRSPQDVTAAAGHPLSQAMALLRDTVAAQEKANAAAENLRLNLEEALENKPLQEHAAGLRDLQAAAQQAGRKALEAFRAAKDEGAPTAARLDPLVNGEMEAARDGLHRLPDTAAVKVASRLAALRERQDYILAELLTLLGRTADRAAKPKEARKEGEAPPPQEARQVVRELREDLLDFIEEQKKILERSRTLLDKAPQDLTEEEEKILGQLAREEAKWASYFEEKLTDFSKLPLQDFADGSLAEEFNETFMEMKKAAKSLYEKKLELAVPQEQSGLENAEELVQNLEKWLSDKPDNLKWLMEEALTPADVAMAELPAELEDIVGELLDKEEEMTEDVEDVTSAWMDSPDKGAGWDALDGPISSMAAKGVTGNMLPNQMEIGGRSGEGRSGRSSGQMVEESAQGKGGRETPTRLSPSPFETGSVEDSSKESPGGATGGGKLSGFAGEGLRGPAPPPLQQKMERLAGQQAQIRQAAEALALRLRAWNVPGADLESAVQHMKSLETSAAKGYGPGVRQAFTEALDTLDAARKAAGGPGALRRDASALPEKQRQEITSGLQEGIPDGYEEMAGAYFRELAEPGR